MAKVPFPFLDLSFMDLGFGLGLGLGLVNFANSLLSPSASLARSPKSEGRGGASPAIGHPPPTGTVKPQEKMAPVRSPRSESSAARHQPSDPPFLPITSSGRAADPRSLMFGLYRKTEQMTEGRNIYIQEHDSKYRGSPYELSSREGGWVVTEDGYERLRAATPSESPTSVNWQYREYVEWLDDPALTVTGLSEKPSECEVTISLSRDIKREILDGVGVGEGVAGVYTGDGSYRRGRPVLHHSGGLFTLSVGGWGCWRVQSGVGGVWYLYSGSAPSQCPADPRAARNERRGETHWSYWSKRGGITESSGISVKCNKCIASPAVGHQPPTGTVKPQEQMAPVRSPRSESSAARHQPPSDPPFLLVTSSGRAADCLSNVLGLYRKTEQMSWRSLYI